MSDDRPDGRIGQNARDLAALKQFIFQVADDDTDDLFEAANQAAARIGEIEREARTDDTEAPWS